MEWRPVEAAWRDLQVEKNTNFYSLNIMIINNIRRSSSKSNDNLRYFFNIIVIFIIICFRILLKSRPRL